MTTVNDFLETVKKENRIRCDKKPHKEFIVKLSTKEVRNLMRKVMTWKDPNYFDYTKYLKTPINKLPESILNRMYGNVLKGEDGNIYLYKSCCM